MARASVLFVCLGNICRSPLAEGAFRAEAERLGLDVVADSAGTRAIRRTRARSPWPAATASISAASEPAR